MSGPPRDRTIDAVRAVAIAGVVAGHWLITALVAGPDGVTTASPLSTMPGAAPATWLLQTLGLLFFAGGYGAARAPVRPRAGRGVARLVLPALVLLAGWALVLFAGAALGQPTATLQTIAGLVVSPLWFLVPYLGLRAATGPLRRVVSRVGALALLPPVATVAASDLGLLPALVALPAAWAVPWLLGMLLAERDEGRTLLTTVRLTEPRHRNTDGRDGAPHPNACGWFGAALACNGAAALAALVLFAGYPASAVGVPGDGRSNLDPPSLAALALAVTQIGVFLMLRGPLTRLLRHDRAWRPVAAVNRVAVPVYLGHQSVLLAVAGAAALLNPAMPGLLTDPTSTHWVWHRLAWLPILGGTLALATHPRNRRDTQASHHDAQANHHDAQERRAEKDAPGNDPPGKDAQEDQRDAQRRPHVGHRRNPRHAQAKPNDTPANSPEAPAKPQ